MYAKMARIVQNHVKSCDFAFDFMILCDVDAVWLRFALFWDSAMNFNR